MMALLASLLVAQALLAWWLAARARGHAVIAAWSTALAVTTIARVGVDAIGAPADPLETAYVAVAALGLWAVSSRVMEGGHGLAAIGAGVAVIAVGAHPDVPASVRATLHTGAWAAGALGSAWSIGRALTARRASAPGAAHFVVLASTALAATRLALLSTGGWQALVPDSFGAAAAVIAQGAWIATRKSRRAVDGGVRVEQPRPVERSRALVDVAPPIRSRGSRRSRAEGGGGEP